MKSAEVVMLALFSSMINIPTFIIGLSEVEPLDWLIQEECREYVQQQEIVGIPICQLKRQEIMGYEVQPALVSELPFIASLMMYSDSYGYFKHHCTGVLLAPDILLTAAHCTANLDTQYYIVTQAPCRNLLGNLTVSVLNIFQHPNFPPLNLWYDIAMLQLNGSLSENYISYQTADEVKVYSNLTVIGYGQNNEDLRLIEACTNDTDFDISNTLISSQLQKAELLYIELDDCKEILVNDPFNENDLAEGLDQEFQGCVFNQNADTCIQDSGAPLIYMQKEQNTLVGINSQGPSTTKCISPYHQQAPGIFIKIASVVEWIDETIQIIRGCRDTLSGCRCKKKWQYNSSTSIQGCGNPDRDPNGNWCEVECTFADDFKGPYKVTSEDGLTYFADYCVRECRGPSVEVQCTKGGCLCSPKWRDFNNSNIQYQYCDQNAFFDTGFNTTYCQIINPDECDAQFTAEGVDWDYCFPTKCTF